MNPDSTEIERKKRGGGVRWPGRGGKQRERERERERERREEREIEREKSNVL